MTKHEVVQLEDDFLAIPLEESLQALVSEQTIVIIILAHEIQIIKKVLVHI